MSTSSQRDPNALNNFLASWTGCDGGNPQAKIWICGIEHGGACEPDTPLLKECEPGAWDKTFKATHPDFRTWQYHQKVAKLMVAIERLRKHPRTDRLAENYRTYMEERLYVRGGDTFKSNLFPFSSPSTSSSDWEQAYTSVLGMTRNEYGAFCRQDRFSFLAEQRQKYAPRVVIGTGKTYRDDFARAFGFLTVSSEPFSIGSRVCWRYKDQRSTLIVTPFFGGRYGMNSDGLLEELAKEVAGLLDG